MIAEDIIGSKDSINKTGVKYMDELSNKSFVATNLTCSLSAENAKLTMLSKLLKATVPNLPLTSFSICLAKVLRFILVLFSEMSNFDANSIDDIPSAASLENSSSRFFMVRLEKEPPFFVPFFGSFFVSFPNFSPRV